MCVVIVGFGFSWPLFCLWVFLFSGSCRQFACYWERSSPVNRDCTLDASLIQYDGIHRCGYAFKGIYDFLEAILLTAGSPKILFQQSTPAVYWWLQIIQGEAVEVAGQLCRNCACTGTKQSGITSPSAYLGRPIGWGTSCEKTAEAPAPSCHEESCCCVFDN